VVKDSTLIYSVGAVKKKYKEHVIGVARSTHGRRGEIHKKNLAGKYESRKPPETLV
jgi:hypothetical protein